ncbi:hypothetical protein OPV22_033848 [Ensete ventricosum]|uniref:Uncharacterized protein n=1 Tax=Ensete ventricosum TaxID=4639 RepID=A0AAV8PR04_ENSVE|nr:hypothetical protein OPV22_033848 [Ensete ventricosum]
MLTVEPCNVPWLVDVSVILVKDDILNIYRASPSRELSFEPCIARFGPVFASRRARGLGFFPFPPWIVSCSSDLGQGTMTLKVHVMDWLTGLP